jgi:GntR family transcriptional repressor for pyruvate dehydrogenase complex
MFFQEELMSSFPLKPQKGSEILLDHMKQQIVSGVYDPGARLPTVVELAETFQVGRSTVREALSGLKAMGYIDIRHGGGTFVSKRLPEGTEGLVGIVSQSESFQEVLEVRKFIETGCVTLAARRRTEADLEHLRLSIRQMELALGDEDSAEQADVRFHLQIAKASHNSLLIQMMESITQKLHESMKESRRLWFFAERASADQLLQEHKAIAEAIEMQDEVKAGEKMMSHIHKVDSVLQRLFHK